jgi:hypothetical protein
MKRMKGNVTISVKARKTNSNMEKKDVAKRMSYSAKRGAEGKDLGKPGKNFKKIEAEGEKEYGSKEAGERVAGAILNKLRAKH